VNDEQLGHNRPSGDEFDDMSQGSSTADLSQLRLVLEITSAVTESWSAVPPEMVAATILAKYHRIKQDIVKRDNGICLSRQCWEWITSLEVRVCEDGEIFVTQRGMPGTKNGTVQDSDAKLYEKLPKSKNHGGIPNIAYTTALVFELGINPRRILTDPDTGDVRVTADRYCCICGELTSGTTGFLVRKESAGRFSIRDFCSQDCRIKWVQRCVTSGACTWCGGKLSVKSYRKGDLGEIYCCQNCLNTAGTVISFVRGPEEDSSPTSAGFQ